MLITSWAAICIVLFGSIRSGMLKHYERDILFREMEESIALQRQVDVAEGM